MAYRKLQREEILPFIPGSCGRLLDIGCGEGAFGALFKKERGGEAWGIEPHAPSAEVAATRLDKVFASSLSECANLPQRYFDAICFNDSLEHFAEPEPALDSCKNLLRSGGIVVASIPNVRYLENVAHLLIELDWRYENSGIRDRTHLRFFTKKSMERMFRESGYDILSIQGINSHYWSGKKIWLLRTFLGPWVEDMRYLQYVVVAQPNGV
jgi:SAM-dependent methyltransferase